MGDINTLNKVDLSQKDSTTEYSTNDSKNGIHHVGVKSRKFLFSTATVVGICSFASGIPYGWTSPVLPKLNDPNNSVLLEPLSVNDESWITSSLSLGGAIGPFIFGPLSDSIGRKQALLISSIPLSVHYIAAGFSNAPWQLYLLRFIGGFATAAVFTVQPIYLGEISDPKVRGAISSVMPLTVNMGILFAFVAGSFLTIKLFNIICGIIPLVFVVLGIWLLPESPHYLLEKNKWDKAKNTLCSLRGYNGLRDKEKYVQFELFDIERSIQEYKSKKTSLKDIFTGGVALRKSLIIASGLMFFQQFSGITVVLSYMQSMFEVANIDIPPEFAVISIGTIQVISGAVTSVTSDKLGRRPLLLISTFGTFLSQAILGGFFYMKDNDLNIESIRWLPILCLATFIVSYNLGLGPVAWICVSELFPPEARSIASAIAASACLISAFATSLAFPYLTAGVGMAPSFWILAGCCAVGVGFVWCLVPETKGKTLRDIQGLLSGDRCK